MDNEDKHVVGLSYVAECEGEITLDTSENLKYKWLSLDEIKNHDNVDVFVKEIIEKSLIK